MVDFVAICNVCARKAVIKVAKRKIKSDKICCSYSDLNFGVTFLGTQCSSVFHSELEDLALQQVLSSIDVFL